MPKLKTMPESLRREAREAHVIQAYLKVDLEWTSILLYDSKGQAMRSMRKLQRLEPPPKHLLRVRKWQGEELAVDRIHVRLAARLMVAA